MRKKIVAGNWKMNLNKLDAVELFKSLESSVYPPDIEVIIAPPSIYLDSFSSASNLKIASQDVSQNSNGAYTGEFSSEMLFSINLRFAIVGHSERRVFHKESDEMIFNKVKSLLNNGLTPIFCCGESLDDRNNGIQFDVVNSQLSNILNNAVKYSPEFSNIYIEIITTVILKVFYILHHGYISPDNRTITKSKLCINRFLTA